MNTGQGFLLFFVFYSHCGFSSLLFLQEKRGWGCLQGRDLCMFNGHVFALISFQVVFFTPSINPAFARERVMSFGREMSISSISFFLSPRLFLFACYFPITWISTHDCCFRCYSISSCFPNIFLVRIVSWSLQDRVDSCKFYKIIK